MFDPLRSEVDTRFAEVEAFFGATKELVGAPRATAKGLVFVHVYAAYEFTVRGVVQVAIDAINVHQHKVKDMTPALMTLYLDQELSSLRDSGIKNVWGARLTLLQRVFSRDVITLKNDTGPPSDGTHYRHTNLITIFNAFGIKRQPAQRRRHLFKIDEVVNNRNQIAHGGETASDVGRRYSDSDINRIIRQMRSVCLLLVTVFERFCTDTPRHRRK